MCLTRSRVNNHGEWLEVGEASGEIIDELRSIDEEDWIRLTDCVTGDPIWLKARGNVSVASADSEYDEFLDDFFEEMRLEPQSSATLSAVRWQYDRGVYKT